MDICMEDCDVLKIENYADNFLIASGLPERNGDRHAIEICTMALKLLEASNVVIRPDRRPKTIEIKAGVHTGTRGVQHLLVLGTTFEKR